MNLQELRIGNHVLDEDGYVVKVQKIEVNRFVSVSSENIEYPSNVYGIEIYEMLFEEQPEDKKIGWGDVREYDVADNFYYSEKGLDWIRRHSELKGKKLAIWGEKDKCQMIEASHFKNYSSQRFFGIEDKKGLRYITPIECERA